VSSKSADICQAVEFVPQRHSHTSASETSVLLTHERDLQLNVQFINDAGEC
jgi:hypothetical protein